MDDKDLKRLMEQLDPSHSLRERLKLSSAAQSVLDFYEKNRAVIDFHERHMREAEAMAGILKSETEAAKRFRESIEFAANVQHRLRLDATAFPPLGGAIDTRTLEWARGMTFDAAAVQFEADKMQFGAALFASLDELEQDEIHRVEDAGPEDVDEIEKGAVELSDQQRTALESVEFLPTRVLSAILKSPEMMRDLTPRQFEELVAELVSQLGFKNVVLTPRSRDGGKDVVASLVAHDIPLSFYFECKHYAEDNRVQVETLRALLGTAAHDAQRVNKAVLVTTSRFTKGAKELIVAEARLDGKDYDGLLGWIDSVKRLKGM